MADTFDPGEAAVSALRTGADTAVDWVTGRKLPAQKAAALGNASAGLEPVAVDPATGAPLPAQAPPTAPPSAPVAMDMSAETIEGTPLPEAPLQQLGTMQLQQPQGLQAPSTMRLHETQVKQGLKLDPGIEIGYENAQNKRDIGLQMQASAESAANVARAETAKAQADDQEEAVKSFVARGLVRAEAVGAERKKIEERQKKVEAGINPDRYFDKLPDGRKALALIGLALSGFGSGLTGRPDAAWAMFNKAISDDIDAQKADIANAQRNNEQGLATIKSMMDQGMTEDEAALTRMKMTRGVMEDRLKSMIARTANQDVKGRLLGLLAQSQEKGLAEKIELEKLTQDQAVNATKQVPLTAGGDGENKAEKARMDKREYYRKRLADSATPEGQYAAARRDYDDFENFKANGVPSVAIMNFIATGLKQGSFGPNLKEMADSPGGLEKAIEAARKMLMGGERPEFMKNVGNALKIKQDAQMRKASKVIALMRQDGVDPDEFFGTPSREEEASSMGMKRM